MFVKKENKIITGAGKNVTPQTALKYLRSRDLEVNGHEWTTVLLTLVIAETAHLYACKVIFWENRHTLAFMRGNLKYWNALEKRVVMADVKSCGWINEPNWGMAEGNAKPG